VIPFPFLKPPQRGLDRKVHAAGSPQSGGAKDRKDITRLHKRSAEGRETEPEGAALVLEREVRR